MSVPVEQLGRRAGGPAPLVSGEQRLVIDIPVVQGHTDVLNIGATADAMIRGFIVENFSKFAVTILYGRSAPASNRVFDHRTGAYFKESETTKTQFLGIRVDTLPDGTTAADQGNAYIKITLDTEPISPVSTALVAGATSSVASAVSISDGADTAEGATTDAAVQGDSAGTVSAKLRGLSKFISSVFNATLNALAVVLPGAVPQTGTAAANTAVTVTGAAPGVNLRRYLTALSVSYSAAPAGGNLQVQDGATVIWQAAITAAGLTVIPLPDGGLRQPTLNTALNVVLTAGGAGVIGVVNIGTVVAP